jgi:hypothetical protein
MIWSSVSSMAGYPGKPDEPEIDCARRVFKTPHAPSNGTGLRGIKAGSALTRAPGKFVNTASPPLAGFAGRGTMAPTQFPMEGTR